MVWLVVVGLGVWLFLQQLKLEALTQRISYLSAQLAETARRAARDQLGELRQEAVAPSAPAVSLTLGEVPQRVTKTASASAPVEEANPPAPPVEPPMPQTIDGQSGRSALEWLSENGLAWLGGGVLALGGLLLVAYAAEHGFFSPIMRVSAAAIIGMVAMAFGEVLRRRRAAEHATEALVAALTTAAGAAMLYGAFWAGSALYGFIPAPLAALLLVSVSLILLGLAFLHGEALGALALVAAFAVPVVCNGGGWTEGARDGYLLMLAATGAVATGLRNWTRARAALLVCLGLWDAVLVIEAVFGPLAHGHYIGAALLNLAAPCVMIGAELLWRTRDAALRLDRDGGLSAIALWGAAALSAPLLATLQPQLMPWGLANLAGLCVLVTLGVDRRLTAPKLLLGPAAVLAVTAALMAGRSTPPQVGEVAVILLGLLPILAAGLFGALRHDRSVISATIGAGATALVLTLLCKSLAAAFPGLDGLITGAFAAVLAAGAVVLARRADDVTKDLATAAWIAASAEAVGLVLYATIDGRVAPTAYALLGLGLALLARRLPWRGFAQSAAVCGLASFGALLTPAIGGAVLSGAMDWRTIALAAAGASAVQAIMWRVLKSSRQADHSAEAASTMTLMTALLGAFLVLRALGASGPAGHGLLDGFTEASLRTVLILAAGLMLAIRQSTTPWARLRAPAFLLIGALHGLFLEGLILHPWWGDTRAVLGPPLADMLALGLLAPGLILVQASRPLARVWPKLTIGCVVGAVEFISIWGVSEIRRLFHGPDLRMGDFGYAEVATYAVALLAISVMLARLRGRLVAHLSTGRSIDAALDAGLWFLIAVALWLLSECASPWWGPLQGELRSPRLLAFAYVTACLLSGLLARLLFRSGRIPLSRGAMVAGGLEWFVFLTLIIRFGFHGPAMRAPLREASLETWSYSAVWALYGLTVLALGARRGDPTLRWSGLALLLATTGKVFLFDMAQLEGVVRAGSFLALGAILLVGALAARRLARAAQSTDLGA